MSSIALKFTSLLVRTLSKPIAAKQHPRFRKTCINFAQFLHRTDVNLRLKVLGEKNVRVRPLNDAKAIDSGATFLSETFIFSVAGGLILFESFRSRRKELARRESVADDIETLQEEIELLKKNLKEQQIRIEEYKVPDGLKPTVLKLRNPDVPKIDEPKHDDPTASTTDSKLTNYPADPKNADTLVKSQ